MMSAKFVQKPLKKLCEAKTFYEFNVPPLPAKSIQTRQIQEIRILCAVYRRQRKGKKKTKV